MSEIDFKNIKQLFNQFISENLSSRNPDGGGSCKLNDKKQNTGTKTIIFGILEKQTWCLSNTKLN